MTDFVLDCYKPSLQLTDLLYNSMDALISDGSVYKNMQETSKLYEEAMSDCGLIAGEMKAVAESFEEIQNSPDWEQTFVALFEENKDDLMQLMQEQLKDWKVSKFFDAGISAGSIETLILSKFDGNNEEQPDDQIQESSDEAESL